MMKLSWIALLFPVAAALGQTPPAFEAASVKPSKSLDNGTNSKSTPGAITMEGYSLRSLIQDAYGVKDFQISGGPKWMDSDRYDINAKAAGPANYPELKLMLQTLLAERFKLVFHRESKPSTGYALVVARKGLKIQPVEGAVGSSMNNHNSNLTAKGVSMQRLADWLARLVSAPVSDATQVSGVFDFKLGWTPDEKSAAAPDGPSLFTALEEQLGVKLEPHKTTIEIIVVDTAEKASEN
jgi:uncharacterized protein (TIGR03435 family)